jgi:hypothetical protein
MGWKDLAKLGKDFVDAKKDELLTGDDGTGRRPTCH